MSARIQAYLLQYEDPRLVRCQDTSPYGHFPLWKDNFRPETIRPTDAVNIGPKQAMQEAATIYPAPCKLTFDLFDLESVVRLTWATCVPILVFLGLSALDLGPCTRQTDVRRQTGVRRASLLNAPALGVGHDNNDSSTFDCRKQSKLRRATGNS